MEALLLPAASFGGDIVGSKSLAAGLARPKPPVAFHWPTLAPPPVQDGSRPLRWRRRALAGDEDRRFAEEIVPGTPVVESMPTNDGKGARD